MSKKPENLRRSTRITTRIHEKTDSRDFSSPVKTKTPRRSTADGVESRFDAWHNFEKELEGIEEDAQKPKELFDEEDVAANRYYAFAGPSKRGTMVKKALSRRTATPSIETAKTLKIVIQRTNVKNLEKKKATVGSHSPRKRNMKYSESGESESVSEDSEFVPTDEDTNSEEEGDEEDEAPLPKPPQPATPSVRRGKATKSVVYSDFHLKTDDYFESQSEKVLTSDRTLARLKNPHLKEENLSIDTRHISRIHSLAICKLTENYRSAFSMWYRIMEEGYSLLLHGLGSKRKLINSFHSEIVADHPTLIVNGFFPSLTMKDILDNIISELLELESPTNPNEAFNLIEETLRKNPDDRLYLLIHNIDGEMLRSGKNQDILSRLAAIPNVRLLASVDHINAPLVWDNVKRSRYNFYWYDATTMLSYDAETSYESSLFVQRSGALALSSLHNVFQSLTANTKAIYILLVRYQLKNGKSQNYSGMAFKDLYHAAREGFLVSSDLALRAQLTEFIDHNLVKNRRNVDGAEYLVIPLDNALLQQFLEQQSEQ